MKHKVWIWKTKEVGVSNTQMSCHCTALLLITVILREYQTSECHNWTIRIKHFRDSCNNNIYNSGVTIMLFQETVFTFLAYSILTKSSQRSLEGFRSGYHAGHSSSSTPDLHYNCLFMDFTFMDLHGEWASLERSC